MKALTAHWREPLEFLAIFAVAGAFLYGHERLGPEFQQPLAISVAVWAGIKTLYYFAETLRHLIDATAADQAYHQFLLLIAYNMAQITLSFGIDFYCLYRIDPTSLSGIEPGLSSGELMFDCFYFSVLNFSFFGYGDIIPVHVPGKVVMLLEVVTAFSTVIFLLSDFVSIKESMRPRRRGSTILGQSTGVSPATGGPTDEKAKLLLPADRDASGD